MVHFKRKSEPILGNFNSSNEGGGSNNNNNNNNNTTSGSGSSTSLVVPSLSVDSLPSVLSRSTGVEKPLPPPAENKPKRPLSFSVFTLSSPQPSSTTSNRILTPPMTPSKIHHSPQSSQSSFSSPNTNSLPLTPLSICGLSNSTSMNSPPPTLTNSTSTHQFKMPPKSNSVIYSVVYDKTSSNLDYVDEELFSRTSTQRLLLGRNRLTEVPERIGELTKLTSVDLSYNKLSTVPVSFSNLTDLTNLILTGNKFMIPATLENMEHQLNSEKKHMKPTTTTDVMVSSTEEEAVNATLDENDETVVSDVATLVPIKEEEEGEEKEKEKQESLIEEDKESSIKVPPPLSIIENENVTGGENIENSGENCTVTSKICGGIPWELCYNSNLKKIDLGSNLSLDDNFEGGNILPANLFWYTQIETLLVPFSQLVSISQDIQHLESLTHLDISNNCLTELPSALGQLVYLTTLIANDNQIKSIPIEFTCLSETIRTIDLSNNVIESLPSDLSYFMYLETLNLSNNKISELPSSLFQGEDENLGLFSLKTLKLRGNLLKELPELFFSTCSTLKHLDLSCNQLSVLPNTGTQFLDQLTTLLLFNNCLESLPHDLFETQPDSTSCDVDIKPNLTQLNISGNSLSELPINIWKCKSLVSLSLGYNKFKEITFPPSLVLYSLEELYLNGNKLVTSFNFTLPPPDFPSLRELCLGSCELDSVPLFCKDNFKSLEKFDLSNNRLSELPDWIGEFEHLLVLYCSRNQFSTLPYKEFKNLKNLIILDLSINTQLLLDESIYSTLKDTSIITSPSLIDQSILSKNNGSPIIESKRLSNPNVGNLNTSAGGSSIVNCADTNTTRNEENRHEIIINKSNRFEISFSDMIGRRPTMEDSFSIFGGFNGNDDQDLISLFDGHAGSKAANYSSEWFPNIMKSLMNKYPSLPPLQWLKQSYSEISLQFKMFINNERPDLKYCGATAASLLITRDFYCVSNIGDTRIVLCQSDGTAKRLSFDHKPSDPQETKRISKLGGFVVSNAHTSRVNGTLAVSRSIGDIYMEPFVVADPFLSQTKRDPLLDKYLIVACDGIWDEISDELACSIVLNSTSTDDACIKLKDFAYFSGSDDNITVIIIKL